MRWGSGLADTDNSSLDVWTSLHRTLTWLNRSATKVNPGMSSFTQTIAAAFPCYKHLPYVLLLPCSNRPKATAFDLEEAYHRTELPSLGRPFCFRVLRKQGASADQSAPVFDSCGLSFLFKDQFLELATHLPPSAALYGLGEGFFADGVVK
jgi:hypothetical protein